MISEAIKLGGPSREDVKSALPQLKDVPSVIYDKLDWRPWVNTVDVNNLTPEHKKHIWAGANRTRV